MKLFEPDYRPGPLLQAISHYSFQLVFFTTGLFFWWRAFTDLATEPPSTILTSAGLGALCFLQFATSYLAYRAKLRRRKSPRA
jgi:hypothetical protein